MRPRLYIETNFIIGYALEQHVGQTGILDLVRQGAIDLRFPQVSLMEAYKSLERREAEVDEISKLLQNRIDQITKRKHVSSDGRRTVVGLGTSLVALADDARRARSRTRDLCRMLGQFGVAIPLSKWPLEDGDDRLIQAEPDDMIVRCVIADAQIDPPEPDAILLTEDKSDFSQPTVKDALQEARLKYMYDTKSAYQALVASLG